LKYLVLGGRNREQSLGKPDWSQFDLAVAMLVDVAKGRAEKVIEYVTPPEMSAPEPARSVLFKAGSLHDGHLYLCTQTEVMVYTWPGLERVRYLSLPCFNDLHHVRPRSNGNLLVVSTGLDMVFDVDRSDVVVNEWSVVSNSGWSKFDRNIDYRLVSTTKPHESHPNYVFELDDRIWVTRFEQRDAISLDDPSARIDLGLQRPHDGEHQDGRIYFTTVDGHVVVIDANSRERIDVIDLNEIEGVDYSLGWCRGIAVGAENKVVVGFSRIRPTRFRENIRWVRHKLGRKKTSGLRPSRIAQYDLTTRQIDWEFNLEDVGLNAVFSIHAT
jgi:hypothetical protein